MKKNIFLILAVFIAAFYSCGTEDISLEKKIEAIEFSQIAVEVQTDKIVELSIVKGVAPFTIVEVDRSIARVNLKKDKLKIRGMKEGGETELKIKGADGSTALLTIKVIPREKVPIEFSEQTVELNENDKFELTVSKGDAPFTILELDKSIATVLIKDNLITIEGVKMGQTFLKIRGFDGSEATLTIKVNPLPIKLSKETVEIGRRGSTIVFITQGATPYSLLNEDESIAKVTLIANRIIVEGLKEGETVLTVKNELGVETLLPIKVVAPFAGFKKDATPRLEFGAQSVDLGQQAYYTAAYAAGTANFGHPSDAALYKAGVTYIRGENASSIYLAWSGDISVGEKADALLHFGSDSNPSQGLSWLEVVQVKDGKIWVIAEMMDEERTIVKVVVPM